MRSGLVFNASTKVPNRFLLCRILSASVKKLHRDGAAMSNSINDSLKAVDAKSQVALPQAS